MSKDEFLSNGRHKSLAEEIPEPQKLDTFFMW